jgi:hypothetical protein
MRVVLAAVIAMSCLAAQEAKAEPYESFKACRTSGWMKLGCFVIQKGVEVYIEKTVTEWYESWRESGKPKPDFDAIAEDYRRRLAAKAAENRTKDVKFNGDYVDFGALMRDVDAKVGSERNLSSETLTQKLTQRCGTGGATDACMLLRGGNDCSRRLFKQYCVEGTGCEWTNEACRDVGTALRIRGVPQEAPAK